MQPDLSDITSPGNWSGRDTGSGACSSIAETLLIPLDIRPPITRLAVGVMGRDNSVDTCRARTELGWESRVTQEEAMNRIKTWVENTYIQERK